MTNNQNINIIMFVEIKELIQQSKLQVAVVVNTTMTQLYWNVGFRINQEILKVERAAYGKQVVSELSKELTEEYGRGWSEKNLRHMIRFAEVFSDKEIVLSLIRQLSWTHILAIIPIESPIKREFYIEMCKMEKWSVRTFRERIDSMLSERTAISKKPDETIKNDLISLESTNQITPDLVF